MALARAVCLSFAVLVSFPSLPACVGPDTPPVVVAPGAERAAQAWLTLLDAGEYAQTYATAATRFKQMYDSPTWERKLLSLRTPLGKLRSRVLDSARPTTTMPGAPDGEYVVFHFSTSFENKEAALETLTITKDLDGTWRMSGYYVK